MEFEIESRMRRRDMLRLSEPERGSGAVLPVLVDEDDVEKDEERMAQAETEVRCSRVWS